MKKITESELKDRVNRLREYMAVVENEQVNEVNWGAIGTGAMNAVKGAGSAIGNALKTTGGKVAAGLGLGAGGLAAGQAMTKPAGGAAAAPAGTTKPAAKSDPAVMKQQQDLIAKGAKIKADGIMGPATQAAINQFGGAAPAAAPAVAPAAAPAAGQELRTPAEIAASQDMLTANDGSGANGGTDQARNPNAGLTPDDPRWRGPKPAATSAATGVGNPGEEAAAQAAAPVATNAASLKAAQDAAAGKAPAAPAPTATAPAAAPYNAAKDSQAANVAPAAAPTATAGTPLTPGKPLAAPTSAEAMKATIAKLGTPAPGASADQMLANMQKAMPDPNAMLAQQQARMAAMKAKRPAPTPGAVKPPSAPGTIAGVDPNNPFAGNVAGVNPNDPFLGNDDNNWEESIQRESSGFRNDELSRIMTLIHHR